MGKINIVNKLYPPVDTLSLNECRWRLINSRKEVIHERNQKKKLYQEIDLLREQIEQTSMKESIIKKSYLDMEKIYKAYTKDIKQGK